MRYLVGRQWDLNKICEDLYRHLEWRQINFPLPILRKNSLEMIRRGVLYVHGRTKDLSPIIVCNMQKLGECMDDGLITPEDFVNCHHFLTGYCTANMMLPGQTERWVTLTDTGAFSLTRLPTGMFK